MIKSLFNKEPSMRTFKVYRLITDNGTYIGRTTHLENRLSAHLRKITINEYTILGEYEDIVIEGFGRLAPRMEYYWFRRVGGNLNSIIPSRNYFLRDLGKHSNPIEDYARFHIEYNLS